MYVTIWWTHISQKMIMMKSYGHLNNHKESEKFGSHGIHNVIWEMK
jgi:hypothetical protein